MEGTVTPSCQNDTAETKNILSTTQSNIFVHDKTRNRHYTH